jgi:hypothetical protein
MTKTSNPMYKLQPLLKRNLIEGSTNGPMGPVLAAKEFAQQMQITVDGLCRVNFENPEYHNIYEGPGKRGLTGHDTLLILSKHSEGDMVSMLIDMGTAALPVAMWCVGEKDLIVTPIYDSYVLEKKLTAAELLEVMVSAFETAKLEAA